MLQPHLWGVEGGRDGRRRERKMKIWRREVNEKVEEKEVEKKTEDEVYREGIIIMKR